jgi:outer membrane biosynthesis protein TonB
LSDTSSGKRRRRPTGFTLERAIIVALSLHMFMGGVLTWWPGLLMPAEAAAPSEQQPLEFRFVDTPDPEIPPETPDTEVLSDIDRQAADMSERDDQPDPFSEGNTPQQVMRLPEASPPAPTVEPEPAPQPQPEEAAAPQPEEAAEIQPEEIPPDPLGMVAEAAEETTEESASETAEVAEDAPTTPALPPRRNQLLRSLTSLERYTEPQVMDNPTGGTDGPQSLAEFDTRGYDLGAYLRRVLSTIEQNWRANIPPLIQTGVGGSTFVALSIRRARDKDGAEIAIIVAERTWSSGQPAYDSGALFALELSSPLPAIPNFYPHETIDGRLGFIYNLDPDQVAFPEDR